MTARAASYRSGYLYALVRLVKILFLILLFYLLQTVVIPHLKLWGIMPNLLMVIIAILTVSFGKKYAFASGALIGILLETMTPNLRIFNLLIYPALALLCAQIFADMSEIKRELLRIKIAQRQADRRIVAVKGASRPKRLHFHFQRKSADDMEAHLRILLNALLLTLFYEVVMLIYVALDGVQITFSHLLRMMQTLLYTGLWCVLMFPVRGFLGMYRGRRRQNEAIIGDTVMISEKDLKQISMAPDMPDAGAVAEVAEATKLDTRMPQSDEDEQAHGEESPPDAEPVPDTADSGGEEKEQ